MQGIELCKLFYSPSPGTFWAGWKALDTAEALYTDMERETVAAITQVAEKTPLSQDHLFAQLDNFNSFSFEGVLGPGKCLVSMETAADMCMV